MIISALPIDGRDYSKDQCAENNCVISVLPSSPRSLSLQCLSILPEQRRYWKSLPDWTSLAGRSVWGKGEFVWNVFGVQTAVKEEGVVANLVESSLAGLLHLSNHPFTAHFLLGIWKKDFWEPNIEELFFRLSSTAQMHHVHILFKMQILPGKFFMHWIWEIFAISSQGCLPLESSSSDQKWCFSSRLGSNDCIYHVFQT